LKTLIKDVLPMSGDIASIFEKLIRLHNTVGRIFKMTICVKAIEKCDAARNEIRAAMDRCFLLTGAF
jgi:hypothetical protein